MINKNKLISETALLYAEALIVYGVDITQKWTTATSQHIALKQAYKHGEYDGYKRAYENKWIPCSERLPEELTPVNVTWVNRKPAIYYENIKDIPFTATAVYCNEKWFWWSSICEDILAEYGRNDAEMVDEEVEILAWQPLPEPYELRGDDGETKG